MVIFEQSFIKDFYSPLKHKIGREEPKFSIGHSLASLTHSPFIHQIGAVHGQFVQLVEGVSVQQTPSQSD